MACAVAEAALDVLQGEGLCERSRVLGARFTDGLRALRSPKVAEVRARGLWVGLQLTDAAGKARPYCERLMAEGMLCKDTHGHTIRIAPPLVVEEKDLDWALGKVALVLG